MYIPKRIAEHNTVVGVELVMGGRNQQPRCDMWYRAQEKDSLGPGAGFQVRCKWIVKLALMAKLRTHDR